MWHALATMIYFGQKWHWMKSASSHDVMWHTLRVVIICFCNCCWCCCHRRPVALLTATRDTSSTTTSSKTGRPRQDLSLAGSRRHPLLCEIGVPYESRVTLSSFLMNFTWLVDNSRARKKDRRLTTDNDSQWQRRWWWLWWRTGGPGGEWSGDIDYLIWVEWVK